MAIAAVTAAPPAPWVKSAQAALVATGATPTARPALDRTAFLADGLPSGIPATGGLALQVSGPQELRVGQELPVGQQVMRSMNNVDVVKHDGRYYMAYRTAPLHFASTKTLMHVLSSADGKTWQAENTIHLGADMREPRFLSFNGKLFLYFFKGGTKPHKFEPDRMYVSERTATGWSAPETFGEPGYVPWRAKVQDGKAYMTAYYGRGLYGDQAGSAVRLLTSTDGRTWTPISEKPQVTTKGAEEPEFEFDRQGNLWGTIRLENMGAQVIFAPKAHLDQWQTVTTKDKYDSALLFRHNDSMYLVARRNVDGVMDKSVSWLPGNLQRWYNMARYSATTKRTAIYALDQTERKLKPLFDLPSHGDTAFPALAPLNDRQYLLLNYSSRIGNGRDYPWIVGQLRETRLYSQVLTFAEPNRDLGSQK